LKSTSLKVDVAPSQAQHLAATETGIAAQEHDEVRARVDGQRDLGEALVVVEVVEFHQAAADLEHLDRARQHWQKHGALWNARA